MGKIYKCFICERDFENLKGLSIHITQSHNISLKDYYDKYILKDHDEKICNNENCSNIVNFKNISFGYFKYCSLNCSNKSEVRRAQEKERLLKKYEDPNERQKLSNYVKIAFVNDPSIIERSVRTRKETMSKPEYKKKCIERNKKIWEKEETRTKILSKLRSIWSSDEYKNKKREIALKISKDPKWLKNVSKGTIKGWNKVPEQKEKHRQNMLDGGAAYCNKFIKNPSKPQVELYKLCQQVLPYVILNYPCLTYNIDIAVPLLNLAIEYDGSYWHSDIEYDCERQRKLEEEGWIFLRFIDKIPTIEELKNELKEKL